MGIDMLGALFSILSLLFRKKLDVPALGSYALVIVQNGLVIILALILNPIARKRRAAEGIDEYPSSEYLSRRRSTRATQYSTASSTTCVNQSAGASKVDLEKGGLSMSRTTTMADRGDTRTTAASKENGSADATPTFSPPARTPSRIEFQEPFVPSRGESAAATPLGGRSRNATAVDLTALTQIDEKSTK